MSVSVNNKNEGSKTKLLAASATVALSAFVPNPNGALAQTPTASFTPTAEIVEEIDLQVGQELLFGKFAIHGAGTILVSTAGAQSSNGSVTALGDNFQSGILKFNAAPAGAGNTLVLSAVELGTGAGVKMTGTNNGTQGITITKLTFAADAQITTVNGVNATSTFTLQDGGAGHTATILFSGAATFPQTLAFGGRVVVAGTEDDQGYSGAFDIVASFK